MRAKYVSTSFDLDGTLLSIAMVLLTLHIGDLTCHSLTDQPPETDSGLCQIAHLRSIRKTIPWRTWYVNHDFPYKVQCFQTSTVQSPSIVFMIRRLMWQSLLFSEKSSSRTNDHYKGTNYQDALKNYLLFRSISQRWRGVGGGERTLQLNDEQTLSSSTTGEICK